MIWQRSTLLFTLLAVLVTGTTAAPITAADKPIKAFILAGQSNMVGWGDNGSLSAVPWRDSWWLGGHAAQEVACRAVPSRGKLTVANVA